MEAASEEIWRWLEGMNGRALEECGGLGAAAGGGEPGAAGEQVEERGRLFPLLSMCPLKKLKNQQSTF